MDKKQVTQALQKIKANSPKRNFKQTVDLIINLKNVDLKKPDQRVDFFSTHTHPTGKKVKICALVDTELAASAKENCDNVVLVEDFPKYKDPKAIKKLANNNDYFIAQATIMAKIATSFGKVLGPKGKMPNPKAGCVVPPNANLKPLIARLKNTVRLRTLNDPVVRCMVGKEDMKDEEVIENIMHVYDQVIHHLSNGKHNVKNICLKLTMGPIAKVGEKEEGEEKGKKGPKKAEKPKEEPKAEPKEGKKEPAPKKKEEAPKEEKK